MLSRIRGAAIAFGLIAALAGASAQESIEPTLKSQPVPESRELTGAEHRQTEPPEQETGADRLIPALNAIEGAIRDLITKEDAAEHDRQERREIDDLKAQQDMAFWAEAMSWASFSTVALTFVSILLIWRTFIHTRRAAEAASAGTDAAIAAAKEAQRTADAAVEANKLNREAFIAEQRAWVALKEVQILSPLTWSGKRVTATFSIILRNTGRTLATSVRADVKISLDKDPMVVFKYAKARQI
jgi:hypothetical protein